MCSCGCDAAIAISIAKLEIEASSKQSGAAASARDRTGDDVAGRLVGLLAPAWGGRLTSGLLRQFPARRTVLLAEVAGVHGAVAEGT